MRARQLLGRGLSVSAAMAVGLLSAQGVAHADGSQLIVNRPCAVTDYPDVTANPPWGYAVDLRTEVMCFDSTAVDVG